MSNPRQPSVSIINNNIALYETRRRQLHALIIDAQRLRVDDDAAIGVLMQRQDEVTRLTKHWKDRLALLLTPPVSASVPAAAAAASAAVPAPAAPSPTLADLDREIMDTIQVADREIAAAQQLVTNIQQQIDRQPGPVKQTDDSKAADKAARHSRKQADQAQRDIERLTKRREKIQERDDLVDTVTTNNIRLQIGDYVIKNEYSAMPAKIAQYNALLEDQYEPLAKQAKTDARLRIVMQEQQADQRLHEMKVELEMYKNALDEEEARIPQRFYERRTDPKVAAKRTEAVNLLNRIDALQLAVEALHQAQTAFAYCAVEGSDKIANRVHANYQAAMAEVTTFFGSAAAAPAPALRLAASGSKTKKTPEFASRCISNEINAGPTALTGGVAVTIRTATVQTIDRAARKFTQEMHINPTQRANFDNLGNVQRVRKGFFDRSNAVLPHDVIVARMMQEVDLFLKANPFQTDKNGSPLPPTMYVRTNDLPYDCLIALHLILRFQGIKMTTAPGTPEVEITPEQDAFYRERLNKPNNPYNASLEQKMGAKERADLIKRQPDIAPSAQQLIRPGR